MAWRHQRFTTSQTWPAPAPVLWISGCGGGASGGGGSSSTLAGGGGGGPAHAGSMAPYFCEQGAILTITIGAGGAAVGVNASGLSGGKSVVSGGVSKNIEFRGGAEGQTPLGPNGGNGGTLPGYSYISGGSGAGTDGVVYYNIQGAYRGYITAPIRYSSGSPGGAAGYNGGLVYLEDQDSPYYIIGTGGASGGGGGSGGQGPFGVPGVGGSNGTAGADATGNGCGGGGGSGNSGSGAGSPGVIDVVWFEDEWSAGKERDALGLASANLDTQISGLLSGIGAIPTAPLLAANYTAPPSVSAIRTEMDANSTKLANLDAAISTRSAPGAAMTLTSAYDAAKTAATQISVNAIPTTPLLAANYTAPPSVSAIRSEMDANSSKLARLDVAVSTRAVSGDEMALTSVALANVQAQALVAIQAYDPPTGAEMDAACGALSAAVEAISDRIEEQVPEGPVIVIPAPPDDTTTVAWLYCYDRFGAPESGVAIYLKMICSANAPDGGAYSSETVRFVSNASGVVAANIPRGAGLMFLARRGTAGSWISFAGVDADTLQLPSLLGMP